MGFRAWGEFDIGSGGIAASILDLGTMLLDNVTVSRNTANSRVGIVNSGTATLIHTTVSDNANFEGSTGPGRIVISKPQPRVHLTRYLPMSVSTAPSKFRNGKDSQPLACSMACTFACRVRQRRLLAVARFSPGVAARGSGSPISA